VDYSLYGVMPMALELAVYMAVGRGDGTENGITLCNTDSERFPMRMLSADPSQEIGQGGAHDWSGYFLCGYRGVFDVARRDRLLPESVLTKGLPGLRVMVSGQVPPGGGLSSSAAMVVASALATAEALGLRLTKVQLASLCIEAERYIGVLSGGMDQSCSVMGLDGHALHIEFTPSLRADPVALPPGCAFVVSNCLSKAEKAVQPLLRYNKRVVECKLAAKLLGKQLRLDNWQLFETLWEVQEGVHARGEPSSLRDMASLAHELLPHGACSQKQLTSHLGTEPMHVLPKARVMADVLGASDDFWLHDRAVHVYEEAARVHEFKAVCSDPVLSDEGKVEALGKLMNDSHFSCSKMFDCSCPELEELVALSRQAGAVGSRLTGAGWGGCSVSLVKEDRVEEFLDAVKHKFYGDKYREGAMFVSRPAAGACVYPTP
jgi:N-acetylgalactosamine kinase